MKRVYPDIHVGDKIGKWTILEKSDNDKNRKSTWKCMCECGNIYRVWAQDLKNGTSLGCKNCCYNERRKKNEYLISGNVVYVKLSNTSNVMICDLDIWEDAKKYTWSENSDGYARTTIKGKNVKFHVKYFKTNSDLVLDHKNNIRLDNRRRNIREVDILTNTRNRTISKNNASGYNGVYISGDKFVSQIHVNDKNIYLGKFDTPEEAYAARLKAEKEYWK